MKKNILIIDDSALMRRVISDIINSDDRFKVRDKAVNGLEGLDLVIKNPLNYDAIILDINMPKMNGIEFLEHLLKSNLKVTVIVVSTVAKEGAKETIRALELGAFDFVTKPDSFIEAKGNTFKEKILECLAMATNACVFPKKDVNSKDESGLINSGKPNFQKTFNNKRPVNKKINLGDKKLVALACSTGGPRALQNVIPKLPANIDATILIVQHMPEGFTNSLAQRINELSQVTVKEAEHDEVIKKGIVYIARGGSQMRLLKQRDGQYKLSVTMDPARNGLRPCADILYESLADSDFDEITCVVLTGMGGDGTKGIKKLKETNTIYVVAQDEASCTVYGMPKIIKEAGLTDEIVSLDSVAESIIKNVGVR